MNRVLISVGVLLGIGGLIGLITYHPQTTASANTPMSTPTPAAASAPSSPPTPATAPASAASVPGATYKDGSYTGSTVSTGYGDVQVQAVISGGKITNIAFLKMPSGGHSSQVTALSESQLPSETIQAQSANVHNITGATQTTDGYKASLGAALTAAKA